VTTRSCMVCGAPVVVDVGYPTGVRVVCAGCVAERSRVLEVLRREALTAARIAGCTCEPRMKLTERGFGAYNLPAWISEHDDDCGVVG